jgi:hypothetical protein
MMSEAPNASDHRQSGNSDPVGHLLSGIELLVRAGLKPGRPSRRSRRKRTVHWMTLTLFAALALLSLVSIALMVWGTW